MCSQRDHRFDDADGLALEALAKSVALSRTFVTDVSRFLRLRTSCSLASAASIDVDDASGDTTLSAYAVDDRRSAWAYMNDLAQLVGADIIVTEAGALKFVAPSASPGGSIGGAVAGAAASLVGGAKGLRYGANLIGWRATSFKQPETASVSAFGSGSESGMKWHWIKRDPSPVGTGPARVIAAISTRDCATAMSDALAARAARARRRTTALVVGDPSLRPGQTTTIADIPGDAGGDLRILAVEHALDGDAGLLTRLTVEPAS
jgi:hypothetical protein